MNEAHTCDKTPFAVYTVHRARKLTNYSAGYETDRKACIDMIQPCYSTLYAVPDVDERTKSGTITDANYGMFLPASILLNVVMS